MINSVLQAIESFESRDFTVNSECTYEKDTSNQNTWDDIVFEESTNESDTGNEKSGVEQIDTTRIKQSLKDKIRQRRVWQGEEEIRNVFEPPKTYVLTVEEKLKNEIRKQRNRRSATKSRIKRIHKEKLLAVEEAKLDDENNKLLKEIKMLTTHKQILQQKLNGHLSTCTFKNQNKIEQSSFCATVENRELNLDSANSNNVFYTDGKRTAGVDLCGLSSNVSHRETCVPQGSQNSVKHDTSTTTVCKGDQLNLKAWTSDNVRDQRTHSETECFGRQCNVRTGQPDLSVFVAEFTKQSRTNSNTAIIADICEMHDAEIRLFGMTNPIKTDRMISDEQRIKQIKEHLLDDFVHISENNCSKVC